jgi:hypothetical protein
MFANLYRPADFQSWVITKRLSVHYILTAGFSFVYWSVRQAAGCDEIQWCFLLLFRTCKLLLPLNALLLRGPTTIMVWHFPRPTLIYILPTKENRPEQTPDLMGRSSIKIRSQLQDSMMKFYTAVIKSCRTSILISDLRNWNIQMSRTWESPQLPAGEPMFQSSAAAI